ncbi:TetR family transcriptional regulator C-terminal domain-containing protein [Paenibacillus sp. L3-i20]|uniref:TetR family transcriptional regulator C-terminal domain-containing protein n=1 Tax=Paenibacillus sp. L3-i20 TaxID=2905833 RepID=UPI001EDD6D1B|nr:TetR family transcriptional regulator C-terminal domain-containing protein [Paenibacillus sp. L3-i20]GKU79960.1 hypothetical protein L3i20_v243570 [Paenibacillus sp. L3-i20]
MDQFELLKKGLVLSLEIERLYALIDGIALHALLDPERISRDKIIDVIKLNLDSICN